MNKVKKDSALTHSNKLLGARTHTEHLFHRVFPTDEDDDDVEIKESNVDVCRQMFKQLEVDMRHLPKPLAVCRFIECSNPLLAEFPRRQMYINDVTFEVSTLCGEISCTIVCYICASYLFRLRTSAAVTWFMKSCKKFEFDEQFVLEKSLI